MPNIRYDWSLEEVSNIYNSPLIEIIRKASSIHSKNFDNSIFLNTLVSVKTGACPEDCAYCAQSARYNTKISTQILSEEDIISQAKKAIANGASRICLSMSGKEIKDNDDLTKIINAAKKIRQLDVNVCCTLGTINDASIVKKLKKAGITAYNHNLDTSENFYPKIITTRKYQDRINTINLLIKEKLNYCSGGIIGMGEKESDRIALIHKLSTMPKHPFSIPINVLVPIEGTPLYEKFTPPTIFELIRLIATTRIIMPKSIICLAAGRQFLSDEQQTLCFIAGANSVFIGDKLLTTKNNDCEKDKNLFNTLGFKLNLH